MADVQILRPAGGAVPSNYTLPDAAELRLKAVYAEFTDAGAGADWLPCVTLLSDSGDVIGRAVDQDVKVTAGQDANVTWFPWIRRRRAAVATETRCKFLGAANGTDTLTLTLTDAPPADGVLQVVLMQATIGDAGDTFSQVNGVSDSQGVAGWAWPAMIPAEPLIGEARETITGSGPPTTSQLCSVARACTTGDLGVGDTITVTFSTTKPLLFHSCGVAVWQRAFYETIRQSGTFAYFNSDEHPGAGASLNRLSWVDDFGIPGTAPDRDALTLIGLGAYPAVAGAQTFVGTKLGEIASGSVSVAAFCYPTEVGDDFDPGGTWPTDAIQIIGNYQTVYPRTFSSAI